MLTSIDRQNFRAQLNASSVLAHSDPDVLDEAVTLCSELFNQTIPSIIQCKGPNLTAIGTTDGVALFCAHTPYPTRGGLKRCKKNVLWLSLVPSSQDSKIREVAVQKAVVLKHLKESQKPMSKLLDEGKLAMELNPIAGVVQTFFSGMYLSETRNKTREPKEKAIIVSKECPEDLADWLIRLVQEGESLRIEEKIDLSRQAIQIVANLHREGITHGDLKIDNFFVTEDKKLLVGDFEQIHKKGEEFTRFGGTVSCLSPEYLLHVFSGDIPDEQVLEKNDIWALGCLILEIFTNCQLMEEEKIEQLKPHYLQRNLYNLFKNRLNSFFCLLNEHPELQNLLKEILTIPPKQPLTAEEALAKFNVVFPL